MPVLPVRRRCAVRSAARGSRRRRSSVLLAATLLVLLAGSGCRRDTSGAKPAVDAARGPASIAPGGELEPVPRPDVSRADPAVREQLAAQWRLLDERLARRADDPAAAAEAFAQLGMLYVAYDFLPPARVCFANAERLVTSDARWPYLGGYVAQLEGDVAAARRGLRRALDLDPRSLPAVLRLARLELDAGELEAAGALFADALERDPSSAPAHEGTGRVAAGTGKPREAIDAFERALELQPGANALHYALAQAWRQLGDVERAREHLALAGDISTTIADPLLSPLTTAARSAQFYLIQGGEALADAEYEVAASAFRAALEQDPQELKAYKGLAYSLDKLGDVEGAIAQLRRAVAEGRSENAAEERRQRAEAFQALGSLLALTGRDGAAVAAFRDSLALAPAQPGVRLKLANALARTGALRQAVAEYDAVLAAEPEAAPQVLVKRATALVNLGRREEALADFRRAVAAAPDDASVRLRYAAALDFLGQRERAAEERRAADRLAGSSADQAELLVEAARAHVAAGRHEAAAASLRGAVRLVPDRSDVRYQLAAVLAHLGRYPEALPEFRRVIEEAPRHAAARRGELVALVLAGRYGEARVRLNEHMKLFPLDADVAHLQARLLASNPDPRVRDGALALEIARRLAAARPQLAVRETLAMAHAEAGQFGEAVALQEALLAETERRGDAERARAARARLDSYRRGQAWSAASPQEIVVAALGPLASG